MEEHFIVSCEEFSKVRYEVISDDILNVKKLQDMDFPDMLSYVKSKGKVQFPGGGPFMGRKCPLDLTTIIQWNRIC